MKKNQSKKVSSKQDVNLGNVKDQLVSAFTKISAYKVFICFLAIASLYGFILWRINVLSNAPASETEAAAKVAAQPRIDAATIQKIQSLQDNSVSVQSLFDEARQNPFQE